MTKSIIVRDSLSHCTYDLTYNRHIKPQNELQLGYFLAGLIDADGHISLKRYITINAHIRDLSVVYYLKVVLHGGSIYKYKKVQGCRYTTNIKSLVRLAHLISNKLKLPKKIESFNKAIAPYAKCGLCRLPDQLLWDTDPSGASGKGPSCLHTSGKSSTLTCEVRVGWNNPAKGCVKSKGSKGSKGPRIRG